MSVLVCLAGAAWLCLDRAVKRRCTVISAARRTAAVSAAISVCIISVLIFSETGAETALVSVTVLEAALWSISTVLEAALWSISTVVSSLITASSSITVLIAALWSLTAVVSSLVAAGSSITVLIAALWSLTTVVSSLIAAGSSITVLIAALWPLTAVVSSLIAILASVLEISSFGLCRSVFHCRSRCLLYLWLCFCCLHWFCLLSLRSCLLWLRLLLWYRALDLLLCILRTENSSQFLLCRFCFFCFCLWCSLFFLADSVSYHSFLVFRYAGSRKKRCRAVFLFNNI